jgi:hypothetical protein
MRNLILSFLFLTASICFGQAGAPKPDLANLPMTDEVTLHLKGLTLEGKMTQDQLIALKTLDLKGENATKYKIVYYKFKTTYQHTISQDEFYDNTINETMTRFFTDLDKNCKLMYEDIVVQNIETGKQFRIAPRSVIVKVE